MTKQELEQFICEIFQIDECTSMILRQINKYVTERRYDYKNIARALSYYVDVQGNTLDIKYGIGIVPLVMNDALKYFEQLKKQQEEQRQAAVAASQQQDNIIKIRDEQIKMPRKRPHIDISSLT